MEKRKSIMEKLLEITEENKSLKSKLDLIMSMLEIKIKDNEPNEE